MWTTKRLDEVCSIVMGQAPPGEGYNLDGLGWPLVAGPGDFEGDRPVVKKFTKHAAKLSQRGEIILGVRASIGAKVWSDRIYALGRGVAGLTPAEEVDSRYLWHWLTWCAPELSAKGKGATFKQVNRQDIGEMEVPVPGLAEQRRIADLLDRVDTLRAKRREAGAAVAGLAKGMFWEWLPLGTPEVALGEHLDFVTSGGRGWARYYSQVGHRFIRSLDVRMQEIDSGDAAYVDPPDNAEARRTRTKVGDVLLTITGSRIGRVAPLPRSLDGSFVSQHVAILRPSPRLRPEFLSFFLGMEDGGQRQISQAQYGQTKPGLNFEQIRAFMMPVPSLDVQDDFCNRLNGLRDLKVVQRRALGELDALFASLQHRAFRGEL
ncbi:type I restriction enzyme S subunit [Micromonospora sp. Llam0]|uniref:restriction endonuclease subunit S n=1 Tax=Micromonospora sp. Llam0 TaxID=2485143 RepID=UPI000FA28385|nr:restriction endonuclease subunit S [Micromonospora sp. Llam0]ROO61839.1 type I restriction enzyme S subunit [Micromonospora sp. Llam0]